MRSRILIAQACDSGGLPEIADAFDRYAGRLTEALSRTDDAKWESEGKFLAGGQVVYAGAISRPLLVGAFRPGSSPRSALDLHPAHGRQSPGDLRTVCRRQDDAGDVTPAGRGVQARVGNLGHQ